MQTLPRLEKYSETMSQLLETVHAKFPRARIAWMTLPILGEDLESKENDLVETVNRAIKDTAVRHTDKRLRVFDFNAGMRRWDPPTAPGPPPGPSLKPFGSLTGPAYHVFVMNLAPSVTWRSIRRPMRPASSSRSS
jgi:hypothetical protein